MEYDLEEFLEVYDDYSNQLITADTNLFSTRLKQWLDLINNGDETISRHVEWLKDRAGRTYDIDEVFDFTARGSRGISIDYPTNRLDKLSSNITLFSKFADKTVDPFTFGYLLYSDRNVNNSLERMLAAVFQPFSNDLRRYIVKNFDEPIPDNEGSRESGLEIPASDRIVSINHNSPDIQEISGLLAAVEEDIRGINDVDLETRQLALSELRASKTILDAPVARVQTIQNLLLDCLKWIAVKFAEYGVNGLIGKLVAAVRLYFGV